MVAKVSIQIEKGNHKKFKSSLDTAVFFFFFFYAAWDTLQPALANHLLVVMCPRAVVAQEQSDGRQ